MAASFKEPGLFAKQGSKLHAKMLSKEQLAAPSFRVYYSVASAGAVPFLWESRPGTPKNDHSPSAAALPPLTPPPSYYAASKRGGERSRKRRGAAILTFLRRRPGRTASSSSASWSASSSSSSTMSPVFAVEPPPSPAAGGGSRHRRTFSAGGANDDDERCFGMDHEECFDREVVRGCSVVGALRNVLATVVGGGGKPGGRRA
jgi:hypothetical protein